MHALFPIARLPLVLLFGMACIGMFPGCSSRPHLTPDFGESYFNGINAQRINPAAPANPAPADTLPGDLTMQIYQKRYIKSMTEKKEEKEDVASELGGNN
ncbi:hypothetical protein [Desulfobulbus elongatus]|uniref:hypothetical protein n=1 Tax=Desulfobulbus elongatus TaxID=53332 RepID=UPI000481CC83|nr:hypothetical protein [Desulfobulbus elongatus]